MMRYLITKSLALALGGMVASTDSILYRPLAHSQPVRLLQRRSDQVLSGRAGRSPGTRAKRRWKLAVRSGQRRNRPRT
jgi:hypothetical protein